MAVEPMTQALSEGIRLKAQAKALPKAVQASEPARPQENRTVLRRPLVAVARAYGFDS